jgi:hypothetical protein
MQSSEENEPRVSSFWNSLGGFDRFDSHRLSSLVCANQGFGKGTAYILNVPGS